ncbi:MAG: molybdopterin-dependent oxidoreductase [Gammaproteobacteria bacterium]|jgi:CO/xanthine dehydrogenase Mo-binding subunit|nr:molybdopterin-dependent oxidoreductase [Gammaproteobacteria bacterium]
MAEKTPPAPRRRFTRRRFLLGTVVVAGGGFALSWATREKDSLAISDDVLEPNAFLQITPEGRVVFQLDKVEMGQGTMTGLTTLIAEELDIDPARLDVRRAPVMGTFRRPQQTTGGSDSIASSWDILRETGATARAMLVQAAADQWGTSADTLLTDNGTVVNPATDESLSYGALAEAASRVSPPWNVQLKDPSEFRWIGRDQPRFDALPKVTGSADYGIDVQLDGMLTAVVARIPEMRAKLREFDANKASTMPGVRGIVPLVDGVAVVAEDFWSASQAARQVELRWDPGPLAQLSDELVLDQQREVLDEMAATVAADDDTVKLAANDMVAEGEYTTPYLAHAPMEPLNATVHVRDNSCEIWAPTQSPDGAQEVACLVTGLTRDRVKVHTTFLGGGFGRRFINDYVKEAVHIAIEFDVPVKLVWPREHDIQRGYFRQQTAHRMSGSVDGEGRIRAWRHHEVAASAAQAMSQEMMASFLPEIASAQKRADFGAWMGDFMSNTAGAFQAMDGTKTSLYEVDTLDFALETHNTPVVIGIWRSVGASYTAFAIEGFMDELAHAAGIDPMQFRIDNAPQPSRQRTVLERLRQEASWGNVQAGRHQGAAIFKAFDTYVGQVAEVSVEGNRIRVHKVTCVVDCGQVVNPDIVRAQMQSGVIFGLTAALHGEINFDRGQVRQSNFHDYRMLRLAESPEVEVHIVDSSERPTGVGEPGTPPIAPAVANAVFAATGKRLRSLPLKL